MLTEGKAGGVWVQGLPGKLNETIKKDKGVGSRGKKEKEPQW